MPVLEREREPRYRFICVAPEVYGGPLPTDDLDEALLSTASYVGSHWDIYDTHTGEWVPPCSSWEEVGEAWLRLAMRHGWPLPVHDHAR